MSDFELSFSMPKAFKSLLTDDNPELALASFCLNPSESNFSSCSSRFEESRSLRKDREDQVLSHLQRTLERMSRNQRKMAEVCAFRPVKKSPKTSQQKNGMDSNSECTNKGGKTQTARNRQ